MRDRRVAPEFNLIASPDVMEIVGARPAPYVRAVIDAAKRRMHFAEAVLCGRIDLIRIARAEMDFDTWWAPFKVDDLWFVLVYRDTFIREYELKQAVGPAPGDGGDPPTMTRRQRRAPPAHIGPRPRVRRNRDEPKGARAAASSKGRRQTSKPGNAQEKGESAKRALSNLYNKTRWELILRYDDAAHIVVRRWFILKPRLLRTFAALRRTRRSCGNALRVGLGDVATFVQTRQFFAAFADSDNALFTRRRQRAPATFGPAGRLELRCTGQNTGLSILIYSWRWDESPVDWSQNLFGVPPEEEQAFT